MKGVVAEGVKEIWLSSEDTGAYGASFILFFTIMFLGCSVGNLCMYCLVVCLLHIIQCILLICDAGIDLGTDLPTLLNALVDVLPKDRSCMLRIGMTNPPYILKHLESIAAILNHPCVYSFLHVPVQSGSDNVLCVSFLRPQLSPALVENLTSS